MMKEVLKVFIIFQVVEFRRLFFAITIIQNSEHKRPFG